MSQFFSYKMWLDDGKVERYYKRIGYDVVTVRQYLKDNFGFKNGAEIINKYGVSYSLLCSKLVYNESEAFDLKTMMSDLLDFLDNRERRWWNSGRSVLFTSEVYGLRWDDPEFDKRVVGKYELRNRFSKEITSFIKNLTDEITDLTKYGGY